MPRSISAPVGIGSPNRADDVRTIQELVNKVPLDQGGLPDDKKLVVDGICGPKTQDAISKFQLKHFGWKGADGKIEPGKQTLAKLNDFDKPIPSAPVVPPKPKPTSKQFILQFVNKGNFIGVFAKDRFLQVTLVPTQERAIYWLGTGPRPSPVPTQFEGAPTLMKTGREHIVDELGGTAIYKSKSDGKSAQSEMVLAIADGDNVRTRMNAHFVEPDSGAETMFGADLTLVMGDISF